MQSNITKSFFFITILLIFCIINQNFISLFIGFSKSLFWLKSTYKIQNSFKDFDKTELCFTNPMNKDLFLNINDKRFKVKKNSSVLVKLEKIENCIIKSNCSFLRPIIFNYSKKFFDVYHGWFSVSFIFKKSILV